MNDQDMTTTSATSDGAAECEACAGQGEAPGAWLGWLTWWAYYDRRIADARDVPDMRGDK